MSNGKQVLLFMVDLFYIEYSRLCFKKGFSIMNLICLNHNSENIS